MCGLSNGFPEDAQRIAENEHAICVLDTFPCRPGHVFVVLRRHVEAIAELSWDEYSGVQTLAWQASRAIDKVLRPRRIVLAALGAADARVNSFPHHHVHVIPLPTGGEEDKPARVFSWEYGVYLYDEGEARELVERIRLAWPV
jgi:diadenosine tetraphosphate (Ap4A) HIT family hydrolase